MTLSRQLCYLVVFAAIMAVSDGSDELELFENKNLRSLKADGPVCKIIEEKVFRNEANCTCGIFPAQVSVEMACLRKNMCSPLDLVCGSIEFSVLLSIPAIETGICIGDISVKSLNVDIPGPFCIEYGTNFLRSDMKALCPKGVADCLKSVAASTRKTPVAMVNNCTAKVGDKKCRSCKTCAKKGSAKFDCSNVVDGLEVTKCAQFRPYLGPGSKVNVSLPDFFLSRRL